jgi:hypothetical protein
MTLYKMAVSPSCPCVLAVEIGVSKIDLGITNPEGKNHGQFEKIPVPLS